MAWVSHNRAWHHDAKQPDIRVWYGGLVDGMRDASGQMYMRNRYYDPATGQFTQTDPIGLAGGLNAYGFAAGDPVTYSDPFGTCPCVLAIPMVTSVVSSKLALTAAASVAAVGVYAYTVWVNRDQINASFSGITVHLEAYYKPVYAKSGTSGETPATQAGRDAHDKYSDLMQQQGYDTNVTIPGTSLRPDAIDVPNGEIRELKPNNPRAIRRGFRQVEKYKKAAESAYKKPFTGSVDTY